MAPKGWRSLKIGEVLERVVNPVRVDPTRTYHEIGIRSHGRGLFYKPPIQGAALGDKRVFWVEPDCFIVNIVFAWEQAVARTTSRDSGKIASHRFPMYRPRDSRCDVDFITSFFKSALGKHLLSLASPGGAGRNKTLGQNSFEKLEILLPDLSEQQKIVATLNAWDRAIEVTERLIANNQTKKRALVQKLLSGRVRLAQFRGLDWNQVTIAQMGKVVTGGTPESSRAAYWGGKINWATPSDITDNNKRFISTTERQLTEAGLRASAAKLLPAGSLLVCTRATIGAMSISTSPICTNQGFKSLIPNKHFDVEFLYYLFQFRRHEFIRLACGSTFLEISKRDFEKLRFMVPGLAEQRAIREILSTCENQIDEMRSLREVLLNEKLGLMQQLLTGKRRLRPLEVANG